MAIALATSTNAFFTTKDDGQSFRVLCNVVVTGSYSTGGEDLSTILKDYRIKIGNAANQRGTPIAAYAQGNQGNAWSITQVPNQTNGVLKLQLWTSTPGTEFSAGAYNAAQTSDVIRLDLAFQKYGSVARTSN
jgi:hypothetical protein